MQLEVPAQEADRESEVLLRCGSPVPALRVFESLREIGDIVAQGGHAIAGRLLADEVANEKPQERVALQRRESGRGPRVVAERPSPFVDSA